MDSIRQMFIEMEVLFPSPSDGEVENFFFPLCEEVRVLGEKEKLREKSATEIGEPLYPLGSVGYVDLISSSSTSSSSSSSSFLESKE